MSRLFTDSLAALVDICIVDAELTQDCRTSLPEHRSRGFTLNGSRLVPAGLAMCLPSLSVILVTVFGRTPTLELDCLFFGSVLTALPLVLAGLWHQHTRLDDLDYRTCVSAGLLTAVLAWVWLTVDSALYPAIAAQGLSGLIWVGPTIFCAMLLNLSLQRAVAL